MPDRLTTSIDRPKQAGLISANYSALKSFLLD